MAAENREKQTRWHRLLAKLLEETLSPVGIVVQADFPIMSDSPKTDVLLLRKEKDELTRDQKARLPDGIRDCRASHILLEFKYTESVNRKAFTQTICYDHLYRQTSRLPDSDIRTFLISSKTPAKKTLAEFGFGVSVWPGVFQSENVFLKNMPLISLNDLSDEPHNAFFKVFASRKHEKRISFDSLMKNDVVSSCTEIRWLVEGLANYWLYDKGGNMKEELTPEKVRELGKQFHDVLISTITFEEFLGKFGREKILANLNIEERLAGLTVEELENHIRKLKKKKK